MPLLLPFFKFYVSDWLTSESVLQMSGAQVGAYIMLLAHCWAQTTCTIPSDRSTLYKLSKWDGTDEHFSPVLACFTPAKKLPGRLLNPRLYAEWREAKQRTELLSTSGQRGALKRWAEKPARRPAINGSRDYRAESKEVLAFLNEKTSKHFREVDTTLHMIEARLKSGVDVPTCRSLIARKVRDWSTDPKMSTYLRPETLFNKTKFESYLAEVTP